MRFPFSIRRLVPVALILAFVIPVGGCGGDEQQAGQAPPVTVAQPTLRAVQDYSIYTGTIRAIESAEVVARVAGRLESVDYKVSDWVEKGDLLFTIEKEKYEAVRNASYASLQSAKADLARSETELVRIRKASESRAVSEMDVDRAVADRDMSQAAVLAAEAQLQEAELNLSYCQVRAPIQGLASRNLVDVGNLVGQSGPTPLTSINMLNTVYVYFNVPEYMVLTFLTQARDQGQDPEDAKENLPVLVSLANETDFPHEGHVDYVDNTVDPRTGTIELRAVLDNSEAFFFPGLFVRVMVRGHAMPDQIVIDEKALGTDLGGKYVYVVGENDIVEQRYVELGLPQDDGTVHVISGLEAADTVIVNGMMFARPGMPVTPLTAEQFEAMLKQQAQGQNG